MLDDEAFNIIRTKWVNDVEESILESPTSNPVQHDNAPEIDNKNIQLWLSLELMITESNQVSLGTKNRHRNFGLVIASVFNRIGKGDGEPMKIAAQIKEIFTSKSENGITYRTPQIQIPKNRNSINAGDANIWYKVSVIIPFYFDHIA